MTLVPAGRQRPGVLRMETTYGVTLIAWQLGTQRASPNCHHGDLRSRCATIIRKHGLELHYRGCTGRGVSGAAAAG
jgi:hypothetical protein